ncbi:MAG TPA: hypothetical protein VGN16_16445 [Acidobacteriaceae bacterium]|jgi:hypothetical protein
MLQKNLAGSAMSVRPESPRPTTTLHIARREDASKPNQTLADLFLITSRRCSSFFAEAAVLVLVFGILDYFMLKGRIELAWIAGALALSAGLLAASIAMDFSAQRWMKAHP